jgi:hypothetical protein
MACHSGEKILSKFLFDWPPSSLASVTNSTLLSGFKMAIPEL